MIMTGSGCHKDVTMMSSGYLKIVWAIGRRPFTHPIEDKT